ncbi:MAG: 1-acyl-sn-glycerol-3-phosphate acyltransferase [Rhodospirillales bacterium]|nr:1-acyl-sn-glycerol-3-phosphate acyltransferase [Rhodospirillales bacterium]
MRTLVALYKMCAFLLICVAVIPTQPLVLFITGGKGKAALVIPHLFMAGCCHIFKIRAVIEGSHNEDKRQTFFVANHISYLDIVILGCQLSACFVAKEDVSRWPLFGFLARLHQTAFISRSRSKAVQGKNALDNMLASGKNIILFPEGTSTDGTAVVPFKSSLFSIALKHQDGLAPLAVQPVTISILEVDGQPAHKQALRDLYAWYGDMTLLPHLWAFAKSRGATVKIRFHEPCDSSLYEDRRALSQHCHKIVADGLDTPPQKQAA